MQDIRIKTGAAAVLSFAAFVSIPGAGVALLWWLIFTPRIRSIRQFSIIAGMLFLIAIVAVILALSGGEGVSYFMRMAVIVLIGIWLYTEQKPGEFLDLGVWLLGDQVGFELGMIAEMGMEMSESLAADFDRICMATGLKGIRWGIKSLVPTGMVLLHGALRKAHDTAELLAVRGYHDGGTLCPVFVTKPWDIVAGIIAIFVGIFAFIPVSEFFILLR